MLRTMNSFVIYTHISPVLSFHAVRSPHSSNMKYLILWLTFISYSLSQIHNANHIFNAIHSSMRQWGSSLNYNGMSFFIARVPEGTKFYHGGQQEEPVTGMEWLAFEPEHALLFAVPRKFIDRPKEGRGRGRGREPGIPERPKNMYPQHPLMSLSDDDKDNNEFGWLQMYQTTRELRLLYVDGMSAAKENFGPLDTQDIVLLNKSFDGIFRDYDRARDMCDLAKNEWQGKIDGIIRMEGGFEIILCDFESNLKFLQALKSFDTGGFRMGIASELFNYYRAFAARFHGIGNNRVRLNYDNFVTAFQYSTMDLFQGNKMPRLNGSSNEELVLLRSQVDNLALTENEQQSITNWQGVVDMIINRYANRLRYMASGGYDNIDDLHDAISQTLPTIYTFF